jgi:alpha-N-arabinofuranosidase
MRRDVIARLKEIGVPLLRWPGGAFTRDYRWKEGLADLDRRPPIHCPYLPFSDQFDFHEVGTDEYMALCRELGSQPCITVTMGIPEGPQEAADWVQYCNGSAETPWGKIRARHGHPQPYGVKYWCIGNEIWGEWMGPAYCSVANYARYLRQFAAAMRKVDSRLILIGSGTDGVTLGNDWDKTLVAEAGDCFDWISLHHYSPITKALVGPEGAKEFTRQAREPRDGLLPWLQEMRRAIDQSSRGGKRIPMAFDEWNLWHNWFTRHYQEQWHVGPIDAVFAAAQLHMFCAEAQSLDMVSAAMFQPVNEGLIQVKPFSADLTAMGQVFALFRGHQGGRLLKTDPPRDARAVDACGSLSTDGKRVVLTLVNRAADVPQPVTVLLKQGRAARAVATILSVEELQVDGIMGRRTKEVAVDDQGRISLRLPRFGIVLVDIALAK